MGTLFGFGYSPLAAVTGPDLDDAIARLREALGTGKYESLAEAGRSMTMAEVAAYAYDQIDQARAQLEQLR